MKFTRTVRQNSRPQKAYTLLEVLVAVAATGLVSGSLFAGLGSGFSLIQVTRENLRATQVLLERMETIRLYRWDQITDDTFIPKTFTNYFYPDALTTGGGGIRYTGTIAVTTVSADVPAAYRDEMRQVRVQVGWMSGRTPRQREMVTYTSRHGMQNYVYSPTSYP
jgi:type II secretory pathway pseudopilin PulG